MGESAELNTALNRPSPSSGKKDLCKRQSCHVIKVEVVITAASIGHRALLPKRKNPSGTITNSRKNCRFTAISSHWALWQNRVSRSSTAFVSMALRSHDSISFFRSFILARFSFSRNSWCRSEEHTSELQSQ